MSMSGTLSNGGVPKNPTFGTVIATSALKLNSGATFDLYNTADQTTNYERLRAFWTGNVATIQAQSAGTGTARFLSISTANGGSIIISPAPSSTNAMMFSYGVSNSSDTQTLFKFNPTIVQSGTAGYTGIDIDVTESATGSGTKLLQRWAVGGTALAQMSNGGFFGAAAGVVAGNNGGIGFASGLSSATQDVYLGRDAADTLALRRSTNAQTFRVYNTYTDGSNYERGNVGWIGNTYAIGTFSAGTGANRPIGFYTNSLARWAITADGHFLANDDNTYDIGASGSNRPRNLHLAGSGVAAGYFQTTATAVGSLPAAASGNRGARWFVTDSSVAAAGNFGAIVAGGGANIAPIYSDGTNWRIG